MATPKSLQEEYQIDIAGCLLELKQDGRLVREWIRPLRLEIDRNHPFLTFVANYLSFEMAYVNGAGWV